MAKAPSHIEWAFRSATPHNGPMFLNSALDRWSRGPLGAKWSNPSISWRVLKIKNKKIYQLARSPGQGNFYRAHSAVSTPPAQTVARSPSPPNPTVSTCGLRHASRARSAPLSALPARAPPPSHPRRLFDEMAQWDALVDAALARLAARSLLRATRPIALAPPPAAPQTFPGPGPWDRAAVEIRLDEATLQEWFAEGQCQASFLALAAGACQNSGPFWFGLLRCWNGDSLATCQNLRCSTNAFEMVRWRGERQQGRVRRESDSLLGERLHGPQLASCNP